MIFIYSPVAFKILTLGNDRFYAMAVFPLLISKIPRHKVDEVLINHEKIHFRQQIETLWIGFFVLYFAQFIWQRFKNKNSYDAYLAIPFEKEAYTFENDMQYLARRKWFAWLNP